MANDVFYVYTDVENNRGFLSVLEDSTHPPVASSEKLKRGNGKSSVNDALDAKIFMNH